MFRRLSIVLLALMLVIVGVAPAAAQGGSLPVADVSVYSGQPTTNFDGQDLLIEGSLSPGGVCSPTRISYIKFDLSAVTGPIADVDLVLVTTNVTSQAAGRTVQLLRVEDDSWDETMTYSNRKPVGAELQTITMPASLPTGTEIRFDAPAVTTYVNEQISGDNFVSFAVQFTSCANGSLQQFHDSESGVGLAPSLQTPNAVTLQTASAQQTTSWPFYAGIAAVALLVVAGVTITRRRTA